MSLLPLKKGFTIYQTPTCPYCQKAVQVLNRLANQVPVKNIILEDIDGNLPATLNYFNKNGTKYSFNHDHKTRPLIFFNGKFIGGLQELMRFIA